MNGLELYIQALVGGITGYITNVTAVKMLFRKILGFGGVIIETREEFIENVSQLVERDIINHGTLDIELSKDDFVSAATRVFNDFLQKQIYIVTPDIELGQVPGMSMSMSNLTEFLSENQGRAIDEALKTILDAIFLTELLSEKQLAVVAGQAIDVSLDILRETEILDTFISALYYQYQEETLSDFIPPKVLEVVIENLMEATAGLHLKMEQNYDKLVDQLVEDLYAQFDISILINEVEKSIKNKTFIELLGRSRAENISNELLAHIVQFLQSPEGKKLLEQASEYLFRVIKEVHLPLFNLFKPELADNLESFLSSKLPSVINQLIMWLKQNQDRIENSIEEALQNTLAQETGPRAEMKKFLYNILANQALAGKYEVFAKVIQGIQNNVDVRTLSEEITDDIISYLKRTNMSEMVCSLETRGIFTSYDITRLIEGNLDKLAAGIDLKGVDSYFNTKLEEILNISFAKPMESYIKGLMMKSKGEYFYSEKFTASLHKKLKTMMQEASTKRLKDLVQAESADCNLLKLKSFILSQPEIHRKKLATALVGQGQKIMGDKKLGEIINPSLKDQAAMTISNKISLSAKDKLQELQYRPIYSLYHNANALPAIEISLTSAGIDLLNNNLENITKGQIESVVATNLSKLSSQQLQVLIEDFMGKELKPISWLGALIGTCAGLGFGFTKSFLNIHGSMSMAFSVPVYAFVGYITNKQALWMIFHPYKPWRVFGKDVPLTQGVIVKSKPRFAKSMAYFVSEELLNSESSLALFQRNRQSLYSTLLNSIISDNYLRVENLLLTNKSVIASRLLREGAILAQKNNQKWSQNFVDELQCISLKKADLEDLTDTIEEYSGDFLSKIQPDIVDTIIRIVKDEKPLIDVLPYEATKFIKRGFVLPLTDFAKNSHRICEK